MILASAISRRAASWLLVALLGFARAACPVATDPLPGLAQTVRMLEPALPRSVIVSQLELPAGHPYLEDLRYLRERRVLPPRSMVDPFDAEAWRSALEVVAGWYGVAGVRTGDPNDPAAVQADLAALVAQVGRAVRPTALIAWQPEDRRRLAFLGLVWNWSAYPRLVVWRLDDADDRLDPNLGTMARRLDVCAYQVTSYVAASAPVARDLFLAEQRARMWIVGSEPDLPGHWPFEVPVGEEIDVFAYTHPRVASLDAYSTVFVGDAAPLFTLLRLLPQVRTNLSPVGLSRILAVPPR